jgi:fructose-1,6-bisphosphatase
VLDLVPKKLHDRIPIAIGGPVEIELYERFLRGGVAAEPG